MQKIFTFDSVINQLIRPARFTYSITDLGPSIFTYQQKIYQRDDFTVLNSQKNRLNASIFRLKDKPVKNVIVYVHCNCGSRVEGIQFMNEALNHGFSFVCFDSRGCGHSEGDFISLGYNEMNDLETVIQRIKEDYNNNANFVLWGRSMGAVSILRYLMNREDQSIYLAILDSPFLDVKQVICEIVHQKAKIPKFLTDLFLSYLDPIIKDKAKFNLEDLQFRNKIDDIKVPLILLASKQDGIVPYSHLQELYDKYTGRKSIFYLEESHIDKRRQETIEKVFKSINRYYLSQVNTKKRHKKTISFCKSSQFTPIKKKISIVSSELSTELTRPNNDKKTYLRTFMTEQKKQKGRQSFDNRNKVQKYGLSTPLALQKNILNLKNIAKHGRINLF